MARPRKNTVDYFPHDCTHDKTLFILESKFGNDGYAFRFKLWEVLGSTDNHVYKCDTSSDREFLIARTKVNWEEAENILNTLSELGAIDPELWKEKIIWSQGFVDSVSGVYKHRNTDPPKKPNMGVSDSRNLPKQGFGKRKPRLTEVSGGDKQQSIVKEREVKERKESSCPDCGQQDMEIDETHNQSNRIYAADSVEYELAEYFIKKLVDRGHEFARGKVPTPNKWAKDFDLMIHKDGRDSERIRKVIDWCQSDPFWRSNILSPVKLRKQWGQLTDRMNKDNGKKTGDYSNGRPYPIDYRSE